jgi:hypothetical protein
MSTDSSNRANSSAASTDTSKREVAFLGLPIGGSADAFAAKLENKGFHKVEIKENITELKGMFLDNMCEIWIICTPITKVVWKVAVTFPEQTSWYSLKASFQERCGNLTAKYGQPHDTYEFFSEPYQEGDGYEMQALENEKCIYAYDWNIKNGTISCEIAKGGYIRIAYENDANAAIDDKEKAQKAQEQL